MAQQEWVAGKLRWLFASLLLASVFLLGVAGFGLAGFGPCSASSPGMLFVSATISVCALVASTLVLNPGQRRFRFKTMPFYLCFAAAILFIAIQIFLLLAS